MKRILTIIGLFLCCVMFLTSLPVYAEASALKQLEEKYDKFKDELLERRNTDMAMTSQEYDSQWLKLMYMEIQERYTTPKIAYEILQQQQRDAEQTRLDVKDFIIAWEKEESHKESFLQYYADSQKVSASEVETIPEFTFSDPIPLTDRDNLLTHGGGVIESNDLKSFVSSWVVVGYADKKPFCVFRIKADTNGEYNILTTYPSAKQAEIYAMLLTLEGCYTVSGISEDSVIYYMVSGDEIAGVYKIEIDTASVEVMAEGKEDVQIYNYALMLTRNENVQRNIDAADNGSLNLSGTSTLDYVSYKDMWNKAKYHLYIKPYLGYIIAAAVILAAGAVGVFFYHRKTKR